jgi:hypothetical protein
MPTSLAEFLARQREEEKCIKCGAEICPIPDADPSPPRATAKGTVCGDCTTEEMGALIDAHPIGRAVVRP